MKKKTITLTYDDINHLTMALNNEGLRYKEWAEDEDCFDADERKDFRETYERLMNLSVRFEIVSHGYFFENNHIHDVIPNESDVDCGDIANIVFTYYE